jgi:hypothetical protein
MKFITSEDVTFRLFAGFELLFGFWDQQSATGRNRQGTRSNPISLG